jgi:hypothetical protein
MNRGRILHIIIWLFFSACLFAQSKMEIKTNLDTAAMPMGWKNALIIEWSGPQTIERIQIQTNSWDSIEAFTWLEEEPVIHEKRKNLHKYRKELPFTVFDTLNRLLPDLELQWEENNKTRRLIIRDLSLIVYPPEANPKEWAPNLPIVREPLRWEDYRLYIFALVFLIGLYFLYKYYRKTLLKREEGRFVEKPIDPHEEAYRALRALEDKNWLSNENYEAFQLELSQIMRQFLARKYEIKALESTSREIIQQLRKTAFPNDKVRTIQELLSLADLVKFARAEAPQDFHKRMLNRAFQLIEFTNEIKS